MPQAGTVQRPTGNVDRDTAPVLPEGRLLRPVEAHRLRRRLDAAAARADLTPRQRRVFAAAMGLTVGYCRIRDRVRLTQVAAEAGVDCVKNVGRDLAALRARGLLGYQAALGRGRAGVIEVPVHLLGGVAVRIGLSTAPPLAPVPETEPHPEKVSDGGHLSAANTSSYVVPREKPPPVDLAQTPNPAANSAQNRGETTPSDPHPARRAAARTVDVVIDALPAALRARTRGERAMQASAVRELLADGHAELEIGRGLGAALPPEVWAPGPFVRRRADRLLAAGPPARQLELARAATARREQAAAAQRELTEREAARRERLAAQLPTTTLRAVIAAVRPDRACPTALTALVGRELTRLAGEAERAGCDLNAAVRTGLELPVRTDLAVDLAPDGPCRPSLNNLVREALGAPRAATAGSTPTTASGLLADAAEAGECVHCGRTGPEVTVRADLPLPMPVCQGCWTEVVLAG